MLDNKKHDFLIRLFTAIFIARKILFRFNRNPYQLLLGTMLTTTFNKKSVVLAKFLEMHQMNIDYVIFVDDKLHHVEDVEEICQQIGIDCLGIRSSGADEHVKKFDPIQAEL